MGTSASHFLLFTIISLLIITACTTPSPYVVQPSSTWGGIDGNWSTFLISVGTPPQTFQILPSTAIAESWVPAPEACEGILASDLQCGQSRGRESLTPTNGFITNRSSTWDLIGIYNLRGENDLFGRGDPAMYGQDTIIIGTSAPATIPKQLLAGITSVNFWLGALGLGIESETFEHSSIDKTSTLMKAMKASGLIPSLSFGYRVGAAYGMRF